jgi:hypothetical protein
VGKVSIEVVPVEEKKEKEAVEKKKKPLKEITLRQ